MRAGLCLACGKAPLGQCRPPASTGGGLVTAWQRCTRSDLGWQGAATRPQGLPGRLRSSLPMRTGCLP